VNRISLAHLQNRPGTKMGKNYSGRWVPDLFPRPNSSGSTGKLVGTCNRKWTKCPCGICPAFRSA